MKKRILTVSLLVVVMLTALVVPALADDTPTVLSASGDPGTEDTITIDLSTAGITLGNIQSISWEEYLVNGYPPHVDVFIDVGGTEDALTFEYAYNYGGDHYLPNLGSPVVDGVAWGAQTGGWYSTFNDDTISPSEINGTSYAWLQSGYPGPWPEGSRTEDPTFPVAYPIATIVYPEGEHVPFVGGTFDEWLAGSIVTGISASTPVTRLEIEVDNWIVDTTALIRNIVVDTGGTTVTVGTNIVEDTVPDIVAISISPSNVVFDVTPGVPDSSVESIVITNVGNVPAIISATVTGDPIFDYLTLDALDVDAFNDSLLEISAPGNHSTDLQLVGVPASEQLSSQSGAIVFEATGVIP